MQIPPMAKPIKIALEQKAFVFGGAYGNLEATKAVLNQAEKDGFKPNEIFFTGDSVAYCANPLETAQLIRSSGIHAIMGNCEESLAEGSMDCGCGFEEGSVCDQLSGQWFRFCQQNITPQIQEWMGSLSRQLVIELGDFNLLCTHASPVSINQFIFASDIEDAGYKPAPDNEIDGYVIGHSGLPFISSVEGKPWLNSGASGMPANDGTPRIWYATLQLDGSQLNIETHALTYDHHTAYHSMLAAGLNNGYAEGLLSGKWPSLDVLPAVEKAAKNKAILPQKKAFQRTP